MTHYEYINKTKFGNRNLENLVLKAQAINQQQWCEAPALEILQQSRVPSSFPEHFYFFTVK